MKQIFRTASLALFIALIGVTVAQAQPRISSGRPGQSIGSDTIARGIFQIQSGIDFSDTSVSDAITDKTLWDNVIRLGIADDFEVSTLIDFQNDRSGSRDLSGVSAFHVGFRYAIVQPKGDRSFGLAFQTRFKLKAVSEDYRADELAPQMTLSGSYSISDAFSLTHNLGLDYDGIAIAPTYFATTSLSMSLSDNWGVFFELFGNISQSRGSVYADAGGEFYASDDLKLDLSIGFGSNRSITEKFVSLGASWRTAAF